LPTCSNVILASPPPTKLSKLRNSIASRVGELVIVIEVCFLVDTSLAFRFYVKGLTQDGSHLVG
jgi:hypothetical protein